MTAYQHLCADLARYYVYLENPDSYVQRLKTVLLTESVWAIALFRFGQYLHKEAGFLPRLLLKIPCKLGARLVGMALGIHLFPPTRIGPGLYIGHYGGIWISPKATLGANCNISQGVTIGVAGGEKRKGPILGDRVWVGPNATITGPAQIGSGAVIGANSLVASIIPENGVAVGVPARVISYTGSVNLIRLPGRLPSRNE